MMGNPLARRDLLLLGGGHTHVLALKRLTMDMPTDARITLVSDTDYAPYSGMLPGMVAGHYGFKEAHIDLRHLCSSLGVRFVQAPVEGLQPDVGRVQLKNRPPLDYDLLSINIGAQPDVDSVEGAAEYALPVKPVGTFYQRWKQLEERLTESPEAPLQLAVVGGGAGSVELILAINYRLQGLAKLTLFSGNVLLPGYNPRVQRRVRRELKAQGVTLYETTRVSEVRDGSVQLQTGESLAFDEVLWCTGVTPASWLASTGLPLDERGFLVVSDTLQVEGHPEIFAVGDVAVQRRHPRPRAGVFAVRQAPILADNLAAAIVGKPLREHTPQQLFLSLITLGDKTAVAERGAISASGAWMWRWKDRIDRKFMEQFLGVSSAMPADGQATPSEPVMHCGGCGAKLPADTLRQCLAELASEFPNTVALERLQDDAAIVPWSQQSPLIQTVDTLRALVDDPYVMGRIATLHALSDIYAMGADPHSAQAQICLPYLSAKLQQRDLKQLMRGVVSVLDEADCRLIGGHTMEGPELSIGLTVNGQLPAATALLKSGGNAGDRIILGKPLGTGVAFAAAMRGEPCATTVSAALKSMLQSNAEAARLGRINQVSACTDVTGFGLLGHLQEMLPKGLAARLDITAFPLLDEAQALWDAGFSSTLAPGNRAALRTEVDWPQACFDPQTSGGLAFFVAAERAPLLLDALLTAGYEAACIGELVVRQTGEEPLRKA